MPYEIWESSNENIVSIKNEILVGVAIGVATIKVTWLTDYNIFYKFSLCVVENVTENVTYRLYKQDPNTNQKFYKKFDAYKNSATIYGVDKFVNGNLVNNDEAYSFSFEPVKCMNTLEIKENAETYIKIFATRFHSKCTTLKAINRKTGYELSAECHFKGIW